MNERKRLSAWADNIKPLNSGMTPLINRDPVQDRKQMMHHAAASYRKAKWLLDKEN